MKCLASNDNLLERIREEERQRMARLYTVATAYTAFDKNGLCQNTVVSLIAGVMDVADSIIKGYTKLEDYERVVEEEYKTAIRFTNDKKGANE